VTNESKVKSDFRLPTASKRSAPRAVADGGGGTTIATAEVPAPPERFFPALTMNEVERWWGHPEFYRQEGRRTCAFAASGVSPFVLPTGAQRRGSGEFAEIDAPRNLVMTRRFEKHPLLGARETTIAYRLEPVAAGTRVTVRDEGFIGRSEAAYGNAEHWERVLGWLQSYLQTAISE
jgi:uncharacterized protein YndB with AHSA1/START domain